jgi:ligand-binding sensor domain-containing protein
MVVTKKIYLTLLVMLFCLNNIAQEPLLTNYLFEDGLPSQTTYSLNKDYSGCYWFGTDNGLVKYNGYDFTTYDLNDGLPDIEIFHIFFDSDSNMWMLTYNGKLGYKKHKEDTFNFIELQKSALGYLSAFYVTSKSIFIGSSRGYIFEIEDFSVKNKWKINGNIVSIKYSNNVLKGFTLGFKYSINISTGKVAYNKIYRDVNIKRATWVGDSLYIGEKDSVKIFANTFQKGFKLKQAGIINNINVFQNLIYVSTDNGLQIYNKFSHELLYHVLKNKNITYSLAENDGGVWITSKGYGVFYINNIDVELIKLGDTEVPVKSLFSFRNKLYIGSNKNTYFIRDKNKITKHTFNSFKEDNISAIKLIGDDVFVIGKTGGEVLRNNKRLFFPFGSSDIDLDEDGNYWLAQNYLYKISKNNFENKISFKNEIQKTALVFDTTEYERISIETTVVINKNKSSIWIGTLSGLYLYYDNKFTKLLDDVFKNDAIQVIKSYNGKTFIGTRKGNILIFEGKNHIKTILFNSTKSKGVESICIDSKEVVWVSNGRVVYQITGDNYNNNKQLIEIPKEYGNIRALSKIKDSLFIGTDKGLIYVNTNHSYLAKTRANLVVESFMVNGETSNSLNNLTYSENSIQINLTAISSNSQDVLYYYRFLSKDSSWNVTQNRELLFPSLSSGNKTLQIYAKDKYEHKSNVVSISILITPPFWETWWFYLVILLGVLMTVWMRLRVMARQHALKEQLLIKDQEKLVLKYNLANVENKALRMQMNPHFIFNALNSIKGFYASNNIEDGNTYIVHFSKLLRNILESESDKIPVSKESEILSTYLKLATIRLKNNINYEVIVDEKINENLMTVPPMLVQPFVENAIIHGLSKLINGKITIRFYIEEEQLCIDVIDNGIGRAESSKKKKHFHKSISTQLTKDRLELISRKFNDKSRLEIIDLHNPTGTKVKLIMPIIYVD